VVKRFRPNTKAPEATGSLETQPNEEDSMTKHNVRGGGGGRKWKELTGSGDIRTWHEGMVVEGLFRGWKPGKFGKLLMLETTEGLESFASAAILEDQLRSVEKEGTPLHIQWSRQDKGEGRRGLELQDQAGDRRRE
jgi:hypothetical protein